MNTGISEKSVSNGAFGTKKAEEYFRKIVPNPILTPREKEVLHLMSVGKSNVEIAKILIISEHTAKAHVGHILEKFGVHDRLLAVATAIRSKIIE